MGDAAEYLEYSAECAEDDEFEYRLHEQEDAEQRTKHAKSLLFRKQTKKLKHLNKDDNTFGTPSYLFKPLHEEFHFTIDAFANDDNALLDRYWTEKEDAYKQSWANERVFCNPPYSRGHVKETFFKAMTETRQGDCKLAVLLIPTYTERKWFRDYKHLCEIRFVDHRIKFVGGATGARGNHMLVIFRSHKFMWW